MKRILVAHGAVSQIANAIGVVPKTVREALAYKSNTKLAEKIRYIALTQFNGAQTIQPIKNNN